VALALEKVRAIHPSRGDVNEHLARAWDGIWSDGLGKDLGSARLGDLDGAHAHESRRR